MIENAVKRLRMPKSGYEPNQTIIYETNNSAEDDSISAWRGLADDIQTYWGDKTNVELQRLIM